MLRNLRKSKELSVVLPQQHKQQQTMKAINVMAARAKPKRSQKESSMPPVAYGIREGVGVVELLVEVPPNGSPHSSKNDSGSKPM